MSKRKPLKIILLVLLALPGLAFWYLVAMPSMVDVAYVYSHISSTGTDSMHGAALELKEKKITISQPDKGLKLSNYGYSFTLPQNETITKYPQNNDVSMIYLFSGPKMIIMGNKFDIGAVDDFKKTGVAKDIELAAGFKLESEYDWRLAEYIITPRYFSLFNNAKNIQVAKELAVKAASNAAIAALYRFDTGTFRGFEKVTDKFTNVEFFKDSDLNTTYWINFMGFSPDEIDAAIGTIQFDS